MYKQGPEPGDVPLHAGLGANSNRGTSLTAKRGRSINKYSCSV
jgi:hypothetical protein